jgi:predicted enzyme related to lactoylglutathione lyase
MTSDESGVATPLKRPGKLGYLEVPAVDFEKSAVFYETLFGWRVARRDATTASSDDGTGELIGHIVTGRSVSREPGFLPYVRRRCNGNPCPGCLAGQRHR